MDATLKDKLALVTGAGRGTGRRLALELARLGATVVIIDLNPDAAEATASAISAEGGNALVYTLDVSNKLTVQTMSYTLLEQYPRFDVLVNAAHIEPRTPALRMDEGEWDRTLNVNLKGVFLMSQTVARVMKETGGGLILTVLRADDSPHAAVRAARAGLPGLLAALAAEWLPFGIRVLVLEPSQSLNEVI
jgi:NAD(P)-dependent dehydrogenase (short-subunit alcohol dehydrogenase family)